MHYFVAVAQAGSFTRAAAALGISIATLSRHVAELETMIGARLLNRTTRSFALSAAGQSYLQSAEAIVSAAHDAHERFRTDAMVPEGLLRVSMPESLVTFQAHAWFLEFAGLYPGIEVDLNTTPAFVNPVGDNFDIAIRDDPLRDSSLTTRTLATLRRALFASPGYLAEHGVPVHPEDLARHRCIGSGPERQRSVWRMSRGGNVVEVAVSGPIRVDSLILAPRFALDGMGIASAARGAHDEDVAAGRLVRVLPQWEHEPVTFSALMASRLLPARTRVFLDHLASRMRVLEREIG